MLYRHSYDAVACNHLANAVRRAQQPAVISLLPAGETQWCYLMTFSSNQSECKTKHSTMRYAKEPAANGKKIHRHHYQADRRETELAYPMLGWSPRDAQKFENFLFAFTFHQRPLSDSLPFLSPNHIAP